MRYEIIYPDGEKETVDEATLNMLDSKGVDFEANTIADTPNFKEQFQQQEEPSPFGARPEVRKDISKPKTIAEAAYQNYVEPVKPVVDYVKENPGKSAAIGLSTLLAPEISIPTMLGAIGLGIGGAGLDAALPKEQRNGEYISDLKYRTPMQNIVDIGGEGVLAGAGQLGAGLISKGLRAAGKFGEGSPEALEQATKYNNHMKLLESVKGTGNELVEQDLKMYQNANGTLNYPEVKKLYQKEFPWISEKQIYHTDLNDFWKTAKDKFKTTESEIVREKPKVKNITDLLEDSKMKNALLGTLAGGVTGGSFGHGLIGAGLGAGVGAFGPKLIAPAIDMTRPIIDKFVPKIARSLADNKTVKILPVAAGRTLADIIKEKGLK